MSINWVLILTLRHRTESPVFVVMDWSLRCNAFAEVASPSQCQQAGRCDAMNSLLPLQSHRRMSRRDAGARG